MLKLGTDRARELGTYIVENKATVRAAAKAFGISKSTVHTDVAVKLREVDFSLWQDVRDILDSWLSSTKPSGTSEADRRRKKSICTGNRSPTPQRKERADKNFR